MQRRNRNFQPLRPRSRTAPFRLRGGGAALWLVLAMLVSQAPLLAGGETRGYEFGMGESCAEAASGLSATDALPGNSGSCCCKPTSASNSAGCPMMDPKGTSDAPDSKTGCDCSLTPLPPALAPVDLVLPGVNSAERIAEHLNFQHQLAERTLAIGIASPALAGPPTDRAAPEACGEPSRFGLASPPGSVDAVRWLQGGSARFLAQISSLLI